MLVLLLLVCSLNSFELIKEVKLERINNQPYSSFTRIDYDIKSKQLVLLTPLKDIISNSQLKTTNKTIMD